MATKKATTKKQTTKGLGDMVEVVAKPIAKAIDSVAGTDIEHCEACEARREYLNRFGAMLLGKPHRDPTDADIDTIREYFNRQDNRVSKRDQQVLIPIHNRLFYRKAKTTNCAPCWSKIEARLKVVYDALS